MIPYGKQDITQADIDAVMEALTSDLITQGARVPEFEATIAKYCDAEYAVAVNSATSALHIACLALGVTEKDIVWTSPNSFVASANCALYCGAEVDFVDIDSTTGNMCIQTLSNKLEQAAKHNRLPKVIIPVHFAGQSCDMAAISGLAKQYNIAIIEDASHAIGGRYQNTKIGSCKYSDITVFSFHPVKIVTTAEGGMALTNKPELHQKLMLLRSHGVTRDESIMAASNPAPWVYEQVTLGFNYRMTELQAALGLSQISRIDEYVTRRNHIAARYMTAFNQADIDCLTVSEDCYSAYHLFVIKVPQHCHELIFKQLRQAGIGVNLHYIPIHTQPYFTRLGFTTGMFPNAETHAAQAISLPLYPKLTTEQQDIVIKEVINAVQTCN
ncbi:UDP-4-amino-4,6-dideoxy-N-acetyl-beta-L-altrosamine transaminase [Flocculibacter collagenilyticus]|uniref:UDP-4-amino-4, 6-dideoxy-N-acetyl-beta-L-altrosamine transaminase n=1 Tax=Flocculibacter collagenilyticus TaxID=2744479 RepID=UPI0018F64073|nr:UDP-4-amino-4,6-dideoxy-N-acetyl-beta-L-altrosamine transaminase [Flocculibacter collagenilyticus]